MKPKNRIKIVFTLAFAAVAILAASSNAEPIGELGILDSTANGGINPVTGAPWAKGDTYRLAFVSEATRDATSPDIEDYHTFLQGIADTSPLGLAGATWRCLGQSYNDPDRTVNTGITAPGEAIILVDGVSVLWNNSTSLGTLENLFQMTETGGTYIGRVATGSSRKFGDPGQPKIEHGINNNLTQWWQQYNGLQTDQWHFYALSDPLVIGAGAPTNISPEDGSTLDIGNVDLLWENIDPNNPADPVYVDVWFGTDPDPKNGAKVVTAEPNVTSVTVDASVADTYYWQVVNYINGPGHINEPNGIEGEVWSFISTDDLPPSSVDAGVDMITWSGEPVPLDATVVDDGESPLTYAWSASPSDGVVFVPSATVEDPTVTITKATSNPSTVTLTLAVNDESYDPTPVEDTMDIDVYDDACLTAIGAGLDPIGPADFDSNCITDLRDYAILAAKWLVDYALAAPVPKP